MIEQKRISKKKTIVSLFIIVVMMGGTAWLLFGYRSNPSGTTPTPEVLTPTLEVPTVDVDPTLRLDKNIFENPDFLKLIQQSTLPPVSQELKGKPNPFVPPYEKKGEK